MSASDDEIARLKAQVIETARDWRNAVCSCSARFEQHPGDLRFAIDKLERALA